MQDSIESNEKAYSTSEIATMLDMGVTTVRKYAQHLEKAGYEFFKNKNNARLFVEKDIMSIRYLKELREKTNITVDQATNIVMEKVGKRETEDISEASPPRVVQNDGQHDTENEQLEELKDLLKNQNELINELMEKLDQQQDGINEWLNERDKDLMRTITERLETQKLIAATAEEETTDKKTFFGWLFGK
ncbi:hypothetical protein [Oceanobacillus salinisoli]|uniref:hypothetical protein n=1 Tax=Oceanobacillus salinisoli TaxID=2678611 RepID=UPI0012E0EB12|nr:hypothetical protein [Oceanobacillus salinisoli]